MSYLQFRRRNEELHGLGCGPDCNCGPCKDKFSGFGEIYVAPDDDDEQDPEQAPPDDDSPSSEEQDSARPAPAAKPATTTPSANAAVPPNGRPPKPPRMPGRGRTRNLHGFRLGHFRGFGYLRGPMPLGYYANGASDQLRSCVGGQTYLNQGLGRFAAPPLKDQVISGCIIRSIVVPFRKDFNDFRQEVRKAIGRYVTFRSDGGATLDVLLNSEPNFVPFIRDQHKSMSSAVPQPAEFTPTAMGMTFIYAPGFTKVTRITFP